jgi:hypothetical protein
MGTLVRVIVLKGSKLAEQNLEWRTPPALHVTEPPENPMRMQSSQLALLSRNVQKGLK